LQQVAGDVLLLAQQRPARDLGGMRGEDGLDARAANDVLDLGGGNAGRFEPLEDVEESERLRLAFLLRVGAAAADAVDLLRDVDDLEVRRERANEIARRARRERPKQCSKLGERLSVAFATLDGRAARRLDEIE